MKKVILSLILSALFSTQAYAESNNNHNQVVTLNAGLMIAEEASTLKEPIFGVSYFQTNGKHNFGIAYNLDYLSISDKIHDIKLKEFLLSQSLGFSVGLTNNLYLIPSTGLTYVSSELSANGQSVSESQWGFNVGTDLMYVLDNGFSFGVGTRYTNINSFDYIQFQGKLGFGW